jgi:hypothetical protein
MRRFSKAELGRTSLSLPELYQLTEEALSDLPKPPCAARTCNGCCWSPPTITDTEFAYIQKNIQLEQIKPASEPWCRFYDEKTGGCQIYPIRPLECRLVAVLDTYRFLCCAPAAQPELMPPWATLLRELLYRTLYSINGGNSETHISVLFDQAFKKQSGRKPALPTPERPLESWLARTLLTFSFRVVRVARWVGSRSRRSRARV